ncbi:acyltransferase domain-containing protein [Streptomyces sp. KM273126]|nr:acyltransferase domain-containing protein [Streptomyces sp. KM273126]
MSTSVRPDPIAVIGMACRLPGAPNPGAFWELLRESRDALTEAPPERYGGPGTAPRGGFLSDVAGFDADFFGISPREAAAMDPQQRLVLELAWEALEDAYVVPDRLRGTHTGVFVGAMADDYAQLSHARGGAAVTPHTLPGLLRGLIANRISHVLRLGGPSLTVDTGQSSGLAAVHVACASLWREETDIALVGAVHLNLAAGSLLAARRSGALSPDGRCHTFDVRANGYARGEGGVLVVLKPLTRALADGDRVHCVVLGSAMTTDGGPDPLTVPGRRAQEEVLRRACAAAGVAPDRVRYVELHGTGTRVGDPVEAAALGAVLGTGREPADALRVGSAKTNVGHLEGAAGMVGLLKTALCLRHGQLVPSLHFGTANPAIPLIDLGLRVQTTLTDWPRPDEPPLAGVSSFGMGGANCHVVLGAPPPEAVTGRGPVQAAPGAVQEGLVAEEGTADAPHTASDTPSEETRPRPHGPGAPPGMPCPGPTPVPWLLSARTASALRAQARALADHLRRRPATDPSAAARTLATGRAHHDHRAVLRVPAGWLPTDALDALGEGRPDPSVLRGRARAGAGLAVLFTGQGVHWPGAGRSLYTAFPAFARALDEVCEQFDPHLDRPLRDLLLHPADTDDRVQRTDHAQPALFALETALLRLLESWGLRPAVLAGHSVGELTAAYAAGVFSLRDAAALVATRGRLMHEAPGEGAMLAVQATEEEARAALPAGAVDIAAVNAPGSVVVSGTVEAVEQVAAHWTARGRRTRRLRVGHAFHSPLMEPVLEEFRRVARTVDYRPPRLPVLSNVTGALATPEQLCSPDYWTRHVRATVRFADAVRALDAHGTGAYVELGPEPALTPRPPAVCPRRPGRPATSHPHGHPPPRPRRTHGPAHRDRPTARRGPGRGLVRAAGPGPPRRPADLRLPAPPPLAPAATGRRRRHPGRHDRGGRHRAPTTVDRRPRPAGDRSVLGTRRALRPALLAAPAGGPYRPGAVPARAGAGPGRGRRRTRTSRAGRGRPAAFLPGRRLRLGHRHGVPGPSAGAHRPAAADHPRLRPAHSRGPHRAPPRRAHAPPAGGGLRRPVGPRTAAGGAVRRTVGPRHGRPARRRTARAAVHPRGRPGCLRRAARRARRRH